MVVSGKRTSGSFIDKAGGSTYVKYNIQETSLDLVSAYTNILEIDSQRISRSTINMNNAGADYSSFTESTFGVQDENPHSIAISPASGRRFVTMATNNTIEVYDSLNSFLFAFGGTGATDGLFNAIHGIAANGKEVHVCDAATISRIQVFDENGIFLRLYGGDMDQPRDISFDPDGNAYIVDTAHQDCHVYDDTGSFLFDFGSFTAPFGVTVDPAGKRVFICDTSTDIVTVFDTKGKELFSFGGSGSGDGQFEKPFKAVVDAQNNIIVSDFTNNRIQVFNQDGVFIFKHDADTNPIGMAIDSDNNVLVVKQSVDLIGIFDPTGVRENDITYKIYGSTSDNPEFTSTVNDPKWINLLSVRNIDEVPLDDYDHDFAITIPDGDRIYESFRNSWRLVIVQMASASGSGAKVWHRGEST